MQYNPGDGSGIVDEILSLTDADLDSYPIEDITRRANIAVETLAAIAINADGLWQFDDTNYTTRPIGTTDMVEGQGSYSFSKEFIEIEDVKMLQLDGKTWIILKPIDQSQRSTPLENYSQPGQPIWYDKEGGNITLYPPPTAAAVTLAQGLKVHFKRTAVKFTVADTIAQPGFASPYHILVAQMAALPYNKTYKADRVPQLAQDIQLGQQQFVKFYASRERDRRKKITTNRINPR